MNPLNSFTSNSRGTWRDTVRVGLWFVLWLALIDGGVNLAFPYPAIEVRTRPSSLQQYFEYGRSVEGKLPRMVGTTDETTTSIAFAGWLHPDQWEDKPAEPAEDDGLLVAVYGMSFSGHIGEAMVEVDPKTTLRVVGGPSAPPNHSYAAYLLDREQHEADVVMLGILGSSIRAMQTTTGLTWHFERPSPYAYPTYTLQDGALQAHWPPLRSLDALRAAMQDERAWNEFLDYVRDHDEYYSPLLMAQTPADRSAMVRMARRAWAQHRDTLIRGRIHGPNGFDTEAPFVLILKAIVTDFAATARRDGRLPIVLLIHNRGFDDHLYRLLAETLEAGAIPYISTHTICPATNPHNFLSDGHFTHEANLQFARALYALIDQERTASR